jgi:endonuclease G
VSGIDPFPHLPDTVKQTAMSLPAPKLRRPRGSGGTVARPPARPEAPAPVPSPTGDSFIGGILEAIDQFGRRP